MDITPLIARHIPIIHGYGGGGFTVNGEKITGSLLISSAGVVAWQVDDHHAISEHTLQPLLAAVDVRLVLIGGGARMQPIAPELRAAFKARGMVVETMDTGAACRTYNVLIAEERSVAAALLAV